MDNLLKNKNLIFNTILLVFYVVVTAITVFHHEIWRDEAQVWLVVRDLDFGGIVSHVRNEGHPLLWYFIVLPFAKMNFSVFSMQILSWLFMSVAAGVFLFCSPFNKICRLGVIFSAGFLYWLPVISRSYSLIPLFLFLLAIFYIKQKEHPYVYSVLVVLLSNTHILMCGFCTALAGVFGFENIVQNKENKKKFLPPFLIMFLSILALFVYIISRTDANISVQMYSSAGLSRVMDSVYSLFLNIYGQMSFLTVFLGVLILFASVFIFMENKKLFFVYMSSVVYQFYVYVCVWPTSPEKASTFLLVMLFCFWIILKQSDFSKKKNIFANLFLIFIFGSSIGLGFALTKNDIAYDYSGSEAVAEFITKKIEKDAVIISNNPLTTAGIFAYNRDLKFYSPNYRAFYTLGYENEMDLSKPFAFEKPSEFKDKKVYYLYSAMGEPDTDKPIMFKSKEYTLIATEKFYIMEDK